MSPENFVYWLKGYFELSNHNGYAISHIQARIIRDHLDLVFNKQTPDRTNTAEPVVMVGNSCCNFSALDLDSLGLKKIC